MNKEYNLEFHPYKGEKVPDDFKYSPEYQSIIDFFNKDAEISCTIQPIQMLDKTPQE